MFDTLHFRTVFHLRYSFDDDADEEIDTTLIEEEDWIEYIKRSTEEAIEKMESAKIRCRNKTRKKMKWKLALRIATSPSERWLKKAAEWNPELSRRYRTNRAIGRPRKRWEEDINESFKKEFEDTVTPAIADRSEGPFFFIFSLFFPFFVFFLLFFFFHFSFFFILFIFSFFYFFFLKIFFSIFSFFLSFFVFLHFFIFHFS